MVGFTSVVAPARAQQWPPQPIGDTKHVLFGELAIGTSSDDAAGFDASLTAISPVLGGRFTVADPIEIGFLWGFAQASTSLDTILGSVDESAFIVGNPYVEGTWGFDFDGIGLRVGAGLALPLSSVDDDDGNQAIANTVAVLAAAAMRGAWNPWLWAPDRFTLVPALARLDSDPEQVFHFAAEAAFAILLDVGNDADGTSIFFQTAGEAGARLGRQFIVGGRLQIVAGDDVNDDNPDPAADEDNAQVSMAPFFRFEAEHGFFVARFLVNIDEPFGFSFDSGISKIWGLHLGGGGRF